VWHASGNGQTVTKSRTIAREGLFAVGDASLGEWIEQGSRGIVHVRRRLTAAECGLAGIAGVRDIRGSDEERRRLQSLIAEAPRLRAYFGSLLTTIEGAA